MNEPTTKEASLGCAALLIAATGGTLLNAWALGTLWGWFVVPMGAPGIDFVQAFGIASLASLLTHQQTDAPPRDEIMRKHRTLAGMVTKVATQVLLRPVLAVLFCWFVRWCAS